MDSNASVPVEAWTGIMMFTRSSTTTSQYSWDGSSTTSSSYSDWVSLSLRSVLLVVQLQP